MDIDNNSRINVDNVDNVEVGKESKEIKLVDVAVTDENIALNMMVNFLILAHKRGVFGIDESAKIWECIKMFQR